jgi:hypothetical protein
VLAVCLDRRTDPLVRLLAELGRWCDLAVVGRSARPPADTAALLASGPQAAARVAAGPPSRPVAVWAADPDEVNDPLLAVATAVLSNRPEILGAVGRRGLRVPEDAPVDGAGYLGSFVRERLRRAHGLPDRPLAVEDQDGWAWSERAGDRLPEHLVDTALGCCAVAVVAGPAGLRRAAAYGAPVVTDAGTADGFDARPGRDVLVCSTAGEGVDRARELAGQPVAAARLSWALHQRYRERCDAGWAAARLALRLLPVGGRAGDALRGLQLRLAELRTPPDALVRGRLGHAVAGLASR